MSAMNSNVEAQMVAIDITEIYSLVASVGQSRNSAVVGLGLLPLASYVAVESYDWLRHSGLTAAEPFLESQAPRIRRQRARLKLFDGRGGFTSAVRLLQSIEHTSIALFHSPHPWFLKFLLKRWQNDLGFYYVGDDIICTTHVALVNAGYAESDLDDLRGASLSVFRTELHTFAIEIGAYVGQVLQLLGAEITNRQPAPVNIWIEAEDHRSTRVYPRIDERLGLPAGSLAAPLTWLVSQVNYVHRALRVFCHPDSDLYLRYRFLVTYHALRGIRVIESVLGSNRTSEVGRIAAQVMARPGARRLRKLGKFRNAIAHYTIEDIRIWDGLSDPMNQLAMQLAQLDRAELNNLLDEELEAISAAFRDILRKTTLGGVPGRISS